MNADKFAWHRASLLGGYYYGTLSARWWRNRAAAAAGRMPVPVLFYHRIADDRANSWTLSNRDFTRHIEWLQRHYEIISLEEVQKRISAPGRSDRPAVSITFDDGYSENCHWALPLLVKRRVPCTYFVTVDNMFSGEPIHAAGHAPNTAEQITAMADAGIEIGAHTATHADLGAVSDRHMLRHEITDAGRRLEDLIQRPVRYFAFPYGLYANMTSAAFEIAREAGYAAVCSAYGGYNTPGDDPFHLQRIHADPGMLRLKNRATIDPRMARTPRYRSTPPEATSPEPLAETACTL